ncbi:hypothetical protein PI124_g22028 [Phytophthora idaei]|nr:hypothetical protein PI125_g23834 [Phytophthora idaei]KAG3232894.1 hypothetical protein PI124_g22028 [Phytophthora idaei]
MAEELQEQGGENPAGPQDVPEKTLAPVKVTKRRKRKARKKPVKEDTGFAIQKSPVEPCTKRPRRTQKANVRLSDYVVGQVMAHGMDVGIPSTYKQARASKFWP